MGASIREENHKCPSGGGRKLEQSPPPTLLEGGETEQSPPPRPHKGGKLSGGRRSSQANSKIERLTQGQATADCSLLLSIPCLEPVGRQPRNKLLIDQFYDDHRGAVTTARPQGDDAGIAALPCFTPGTDFFKKILHYGFVI